MGCTKKMEMKRIFLIELIVVMLMIAITSPTMVEVGKAATITDTVVVTFNPKGNLTIEVFPATWSAGELYVNQSATTSTTNFTAYNNGTVTWATLWVHAATGQDMTLVASSPGSDEFMMLVNGTGTDITTWTEIHTNRTLETSVATDASENFGLNITMGTVFTSDWDEQTSTVTLTAVGA